MDIEDKRPPDMCACVPVCVHVRVCTCVCIHVCACYILRKGQLFVVDFNQLPILLECRVYAKHSGMFHLMSREGVR